MEREKGSGGMSSGEANRKEGKVYGKLENWKTDGIENRAQWGRVLAEGRMGK